LEGSFTVNQIAVELERLQPDKNHKWEIQITGTDAFIINFPSADLLETVVNWAPMDAKAVKGEICFEKETDNEVYKREISKVWVQFRGLPREHKEFPIVWVVGTILGVPRAVDTLFTSSTRAVDTLFTSSTGRARMKVAVLDPTLIPDVDVVIRDYIYELQFALENSDYVGEPQVIDLDYNEEDPKGEDPKGAPKEDNLTEEKPEENMEVDGKQGDDTPPVVRQQHGAPMEVTLLQDIHQGKLANTSKKGCTFSICRGLESFLASLKD
jgi:hypothetical protein